MLFLFRLLEMPAHQRSPVQRTEASMPSGSFLPFVPFSPFLFRLLESLPPIGVPSSHTNHQPGANWNPQNPPFAGRWNGFA